MPPLVHAITALLMSTTLVGKSAYQFIHVVASLCNFLLYPEKYMIEASALDSRLIVHSLAGCCPSRRKPALRGRIRLRLMPACHKPDLWWRGDARVACSAC